jgi:hypothetical protein
MTRNRRGGVFGFSTPDKFKKEVKQLIKFNEMDDKTETEYMFDEPTYTSNFGKIHDIWSKLSPREKLEVGSSFVKARNDIFGDHKYREDSYKTIIEDLKNTDKKVNSQSYISKNSLRPPSVEEKEKEIARKILLREIPTGSDPYSVSSGGKSRRRHRRRRTLHKRRKSRKVRKTRCRRK